MKPKKRKRKVTPSKKINQDQTANNMLKIVVSNQTDRTNQSEAVSVERIERVESEIQCRAKGEVPYLTPSVAAVVLGEEYAEKTRGTNEVKAVS